MPNSSAESIQANILEWLDPGEHLVEFTMGSLQSQSFQFIIALTDRSVRLGSPTGGRTIPLGDLKSLDWSALWARLNISVESPRERLVLSVLGKEWKVRAARLANAWKERNAAQ